MTPIKVYTKAECPACDLTVRWLERKGIPYVLEPFEESPLAQTLAEIHGFKTAPLCVHGGEVWAGFRPDLITEAARNI